MLTYSLHNIGSDCLYEYLYKCIKDDIVAGKLAVGTKLPSKRSLAKNLNISTITVENAYGQLVSEGYLYVLPKKGFFVAELKNIVLQVNRQTCSKFKIPSNKKDYFMDFTNNQTSPSNFPFTIWTKLVREIMVNKENELMINSPSGGVVELREAIAKHLRDFRGMQVAQEQIIIGAGTEYLYGLLIQLLGYEKIYAVEDPGYRKISQIYKSNNVVCAHIPLDDEGVNVDALESSHADVLHISPSHHFPTGIITPISRRYELLGWASRADGRYIIEDDYDSEFRLLGKPIPAMQNIDVMEKIIYMNTFSKSLTSTIRISYMVLPKHLLEKFYRELYFYSCTVSNFEQYTLAAFLQANYFEKHINRMRIYYKKIRDGVLDAFRNSSLYGKAMITEENSGLHFLMTVQTQYTDAELLERAAARGLKITCLSQYYHQQEGVQEHIIIMNYSGIRLENVAEALEILNTCL